MPVADRGEDRTGRVAGLGPRLDQHLDGLGMTEPRRHTDRAEAVGIIADVNLGTGSEEQLHDLDTIRVGREIERGAIEFGLDVDRDASVEQGTHPGDIAVASRLPKLFVARVDIGVGRRRERDGEKHRNNKACGRTCGKTHTKISRVGVDTPSTNSAAQG